MNLTTLVFRDGRLEDTSNLATLPAEITIDCQQGLYLHVPKNLQVATPIHLVFLRSVAGPQTLRHKIIMDEHAQLTLFEEHRQEGDLPLATMTEVVVQWQLKGSAKLHYFRLQDENPAATHHFQMEVEQETASSSHLFFADCGGRSARTQVNIHLNQRDATCDLYGFYFLNQDEQTVHHQLHIEHQAPYCSSAMRFKGILDKKSKAFFCGKVYVHETAQQITAHQANHNLLLSPMAEVYAQPQLEIYADDVKCTHGATVGQLDNESLFYLQSRGITRAVALKLLTQAFAADIINQLPDATIRDYIQARVDRHEII